MARLHAAVVVGLVLALAPALSEAQSLGDAAKKEKARRKETAAATTKPAKVITEDDLRSAAGNANMAGDNSGEAAANGEKKDGEKKDEKAEGKDGKKEKSEEEVQAEAQKAWSEKLQKAEAEVARLQKEVETAQTALNDMTGPLYGPARADRATRLEDAQKALTAAQQSVADIQEEGRRSRFR